MALANVTAHITKFLLPSAHSAVSTRNRPSPRSWSRVSPVSSVFTVDPDTTTASLVRLLRKVGSSVCGALAIGSVTSDIKALRRCWVFSVDVSVACALPLAMVPKRTEKKITRSRFWYIKAPL